MVRQWLAVLKGEARAADQQPSEKNPLPPSPLLELIGKDLAKVGGVAESPEDVAIELIEAAVEDAEAEGADLY